jgi:leucyl aminopeptidase
MQTIKVILCFALISSVFSRPQTEENRLIKVQENEPAKWLTENEILALIATKTHFIDITDRTYPADLNNIAPKAFPTTLRFQSIVNQAIPRINIPRMQTFVDTFDDFDNRYYNNLNGVNASNWLRTQVLTSIENSNYPGDASVEFFEHAAWAQNSIVARIEGSDPALSKEVIIFGAHLDSINSRTPTTGIAPGSDDNASGSVTVLETLRVILASGFIPKRSIEFQWYAAEEVGLRGSGQIAESYFRANTDVIAMVNFDVVGYRAGANEIGLLTDYTNQALNVFIKMIVDEYCTYRWVNDYCGYGCSDHASFHSYGFPACSPSEYPLNPYMHTTSDTMDRMSFEQVAEFVKLSVGAAIELAEPNTM